MQNLSKESKNILIGTLIGGAIGVCLASIYLASKKEERKSDSSLSTLGKVVVQMGEMLTSEDVKSTPLIKDVEKKAHKHEGAILEILDLLSMGIHVWEKFKKG